MFEIACMDFENHKAKSALVLYAVHELYEQNIGDLKEGISIKKTVPLCQHLLGLELFEKGSIENDFLERLTFALMRCTDPSLYFDKDFSKQKPRSAHTFISDAPEFLPAPSSVSPA